MRSLLRVETGVGELVVGVSGREVCLCDWAGSRRFGANLRRVEGLPAGNEAVAAQAVRELEEYFAGARREFEVRVRLVGSEFQRRVWGELLKIPYGVTISYGELARRVGSPTGVRAVAQAVGANPISVIVPCHRVVGADSRLTGYSGGLAAKRYLLGLEQGWVGSLF